LRLVAAENESVGEGSRARVGVGYCKCSTIIAMPND